MSEPVYDKNGQRRRWQSYRCACAFAKELGDKDPCNFPRVGMADNVLYRGHWIVRHKPTGTEAVIGVGRGALAPEADACCFGWFDETACAIPEPRE